MVFKSVKVAVFAEGSAADEDKAAGADVVGKDELIEEIKFSGKINFGKYIATHSKMQRVNNETSSCRLSALPSELLKAIVHQMGFKEAVRASILSKVFRDLWHGIQDIQISDKNLKALKGVNLVREGGGSCNMVNVVPHVRSFELLITDMCSKSKLKSALKWGLERDVKEVVIIYDQNGEISRYPRVLFKMESLVSLCLETPARVTLPVSIRLPNLKSFDFNMRNYKFADLANAVVKACPLLEDVYISIDLDGASAAIPCHLKLENSSIRWIRIRGSGTIGKEVIVDCEAHSLKLLSLVTPHIIVLQNRNFIGLRALNYLVTDFQQFQEFISILNSCEILEELEVMFKVAVVLQNNWRLDINSRKLKMLEICGDPNMTKDRHMTICCEAHSLSYLSLLTPNILILENNNFIGLRALNYLVTNFRQFQEFIPILNSCEVLEELKLMFNVVTDVRINWSLYINNEKLKVVKMGGQLNISTNKRFTISFQTPELRILHIVFRDEQLPLFIKWKASCKLERKHISPLPVRDGLILEKH